LEEGKKNKLSQSYLGSLPSEAPRHRVKITHSFYLGVHQVTQAEYEKVMGVNPSAFTEKQIDASGFKPPLSDREAMDRPEDRKRVAGRETGGRPVETVNWLDAMEFCRKLSDMPAERAAKRVYRLPSEAEWEYACRAGTTTSWSSGDDEAGLVDVAWFITNAESMPHPVGQKKPNAWGLYDMSGNVSQWCADWYSKDYYQETVPVDPPGPGSGSCRVLRGGWYLNFPCELRSAFRDFCPPDYRADHFGFRVVAGR
jgi:formylglycine-generating enzyme required for sulfatase activity